MFRKADDCKWDFVIFTQQWLPTYCSRPSFDVGISSKYFNTNKLYFYLQYS